MKKILIIGPIGDFGGRELESGFMASALSSKYIVDICTTGSLSNKSQVFNFNKKQKVFSLADLACQQYLVLKLLALLSYVKNSCKGVWSSYVNNNIAKYFFNYNKKRLLIVQKLVAQYDVIFICAQLSSSLVNDIITFAKLNNKKILFRTTGTISEGSFPYIENVNSFIHHSKVNASNLEKFKNHDYVIIDQCAFNEKELLNVSLSQSGIHNFLILGRLSPEKGVEELISFFLQVCLKNDTLYLAGNGPLENYLRNKYKEADNIKFLGFIEREHLSDLFNRIDCLIICSPEESGPLVGVESMAAGKLIISTRVGAMTERLAESLNQFWFDYNDLESFKKTVQSVKLLNQDEVKSISDSLRDCYLKDYSLDKIKKKYLSTVNGVLNK
ncbi:hypothetical protein B0A79_13570 [Flavobacterium piscis]|uniref:Glycosyl transferase family 1 domain-containing protein n=1 Tax=Flavobacterium piscis TaxID=1114874 RepID=A0ABX2XEK6_9FLAO|nr:glycosyltransferase [Flavobacterium piscis]OCB70585.1 hypothetical protein FLP_18080 [Flavobacterium piscis]OXG03711.1 hypothetical protein B0A79_13570 [Flavobacterium piscis]